MATPMFRTTLRITLAAATLSTCLWSADQKNASAPKWAENYNIPLWDEGKVPMANGTGPLDMPFLTVFQPAPGKGNGAGVIIAPGGSNIMLMYGAEGVEAAERFNDWGVTAFVLTYRLSPRYNAAARALDGKRALQVVRSKAAELKLDPKRIGIVGFSAGSELARASVGAAATVDANAADPIDRLNARPDFLVLVYNNGRGTPGEDLKSYPPTYLLSAAADGPANGAAQLFTEMNRAGATVELHLYQKGRHGFGAATKSREFGPWMDSLKHFLTIGGFIPEAK